MTREVRSEGTFPPYRKWIFHILDNKSTTCFSPLSPACSFAEMLLPLRDTVPHLRFLHIFAVLLIIPQYSHQGKQVPEAHNTIRDIMKGETCLSQKAESATANVIKLRDLRARYGVSGP